MGDAGKNRNFSGLLVWCFAAMLCVAQFQMGSHFHHQDDVTLKHECTTCATASHHDDADAAEFEFISQSRQSALHPPHFEKPLSRLFLAHANVRGPPVLLH